MIAGVAAALIWQAWPRIGWLPALPAALAGIHGFVVGTAVGLVVIVVGTFAGRPAPQSCVDKAWGSGVDSADEHRSAVGGRLCGRNDANLLPGSK